MVIKHFGLPFFLGVSILVLLMLPPQNLSSLSSLGDLPVDKLVHVILFTAFTLSLTIAFKKQPSGRKRQRAFLYALVIGIAFGGLTELGQQMAGWGRTAEITDFIADIGGCFLSLPVFKLIYGKECQYS